jgi:uncharacterized protein YndB with AHSA1/START domain
MSDPVATVSQPWNRPTVKGSRTPAATSKWNPTGSSFRPVAPANGAGGLAFTARIEIEPAADGGTRYRAIAMHAHEEASKQHADMGFNVGWGAALDQLVTLMT